MALWNRLDGKDAPNPVRATPRPQTAKPEARAVPYATIARILDQMPQSTAKQHQAKRRVTVIHEFVQSCKTLRIRLEC
jgi:hypothetical protein